VASRSRITRHKSGPRGRGKETHLAKKQREPSDPALSAASNGQGAGSAEDPLRPVDVGFADYGDLQARMTCNDTGSKPDD
jgi:hypothetical protein